jgi:hypothetical protein
MVWQALPGREIERAALDLIGASASWRPLSLSPSRTLASLLSLGPPLALMIMAGGLPFEVRKLLLAGIAGMTVISAVLGAAQLAAGGAAFRLYEHTHSGWLTGFQANRNAQADVLLIGMVALAAALAGASLRHKDRLILF